MQECQEQVRLISKGQRTMQQRLWIRLAWWTVFAAAFGYIEALVVVYIRRLTHMPPRADYRQIWASWGVPLNSRTIFQEMARNGILWPEISRETATLVLLLGAAVAAGRTARERLGLFAWTFAIWDLTYYLWLKLWTGFPQSLTATDIYYLVPIAWYGPVWFPILVFMPATLILALRLLSKPFPSAAEMHLQSDSNS
jgi:hypothetical protein